MNKLLSLVFVLVISGTSSTYAIPVVALAAAQTGLTIQVGSGCGLGVRRGPFNGCDPVYVYGGYGLGYYQGYRRGHYRGYRDTYYDGSPYFRFDNGQDVIAVDKGFCGFGSYLSCSHGLCWRFCY
jgi:hypothetical protein